MLIPSPAPPSPSREEEPAKLLQLLPGQVLQLHQGQGPSPGKPKRVDRMNHEVITELNNLVAERGMLSDTTGPPSKICWNIAGSFQKKTKPTMTLISGQPSKSLFQMVQDLQELSFPDFKD